MNKNIVIVVILLALIATAVLVIFLIYNVNNEETCGNQFCNSNAGENCDSCSSDCGNCPLENNLSDTPYCGDNICQLIQYSPYSERNGLYFQILSLFDKKSLSPIYSEDCSSCPQDCGECLTLYCGDKKCNNGENCFTCSDDCGKCVIPVTSGSGSSGGSSGSGSGNSGDSGNGNEEQNETEQTDNIPSTPILTLNSVGTNFIVLNWSASIDDKQVREYVLYKNNNLLINTTLTSYRDSNVISNTNYSYYIEAIDSSGQKSNKSFFNVTTLKVNENVISENFYSDANIVPGALYSYKVSAVYNENEGLPSYSVTTSKIYEVGEDKEYKNLSSISWSNLKPGDVVKIHYRPNLGPYREIIRISKGGNATHPLRIIGIPGPNGELPVLDGENATTDRQFRINYKEIEGSGLIIVYNEGWEAIKPANIEIEGLYLTHAHRNFNFTNSYNEYMKFGGSAGCIYVLGVDNLTIRNNVLTYCGNGILYVPAGQENRIIRDSLIQGNIIYDNGVVDSDRRHNTYTEGIGITYEYNYFGKIKQGSNGGALKDRSIGATIRYNYIFGGSRNLDIVEPENACSISCNDPYHNNTYIYGNLLVGDSGRPGTFVHYGSDNDASKFRKGILYFFYNTIISQSDQSGTWRRMLFSLTTNNQSVYAGNNFIYHSGVSSTPSDYFLTTANGIFNFNRNLISNNWKLKYEWQNNFKSVITGDNTIVNYTLSNITFKDLNNKDLRLADNSVAIGKSVSLPSALNSFNVDKQYSNASAIPRDTANDIGAYESGIKDYPLIPTRVIAVSSGNKINITWMPNSNGIKPTSYKIYRSVNNGNFNLIN